MPKSKVNLFASGPALFFIDNRSLIYNCLHTSYIQKKKRDLKFSTIENIDVFFFSRHLNIYIWNHIDKSGLKTKIPESSLCLYKSVHENKLGPPRSAYRVNREEADRVLEAIGMSETRGDPGKETERPLTETVESQERMLFQKLREKRVLKK